MCLSALSVFLCGLLRRALFAPRPDLRILSVSRRRDMTRRDSVLRTIASVGAAALWLGTAAHHASAQQNAQTPPATVGGFVAPVNVDTAKLPGPVQPIFFRHDIHAGQYQINCLYCHFSAEVSFQPGVPTISTCMGCHQMVGSSNPEVAKLRAAAAQQKPVEWKRIHTLPPFVHFPHMRHVKAQVTCQTCHGPIETMPRVSQVPSLKMGWCITCHLQRKVTTDCTACHF